MGNDRGFLREPDPSPLGGRPRVPPREHLDRDPLGAAQRRSLGNFPIEVSLSCNLLASAERVDRVGRVRSGVASFTRQTGWTPPNQLGGSDWRRGVLPRKKGRAGIAWGKDGKGAKLIILTDADGTPLSVTVAGANQVEVTRVEPLIENRVTKRLLYDPAVDSDPLRDQLKLQAIELICPHRKNRKRALTQDGRPLRRYKPRYRVERTISWLQSRRRIAIRHEYHPHLFCVFAQLTCPCVVINGF